jgi:DNA-binding NarL/FixJ family response regulator
MSSVLIADDHAVVRAGLRRLLMDGLGIGRVGEAADGADTLAQLRASDWDLLILDIGLPDRTGIDVLRHVRAEHEATRVLVISGYPERQFALNVIRAGAAGYLVKSAAGDELLRAVSVVLQGRRYVSATLAEMLVSERSVTDGQPVHARLSEREFQIFTKLASGDAVTAIAAQLELSVKTVSTYRSRVLEKLGLQTNADLTSYALRNELIA